MQMMQMTQMLFPNVNRKLLAHILTNIPTHPHTETSDLDNYNKLRHRLSLKTKTVQSKL